MNHFLNIVGLFIYIYVMVMLTPLLALLYGIFGVFIAAKYLVKGWQRVKFRAIKKIKSFYTYHLRRPILIKGNNEATQIPETYI